MSKYSYAETVKVLPLMGPKDTAATAINTSQIDLDLAAGIVEIEVNFGLITDSDSTSGATVTILCSTAGSSSDTNTAIAFKYRKSAAVDSDSMGALTDATSAGVAVLEATDNVTLLCYVDPAAVQAAVTDGRFVGALITPDANVNATLVGAVARYTPRYAGASMPSST